MPGGPSDDGSVRFLIWELVYRGGTTIILKVNVSGALLSLSVVPFASAPSPVEELANAGVVRLWHRVNAYVKR